MRLKTICAGTRACALLIITGAFLTAGGSVSHAQAPGIGNEAGQPFQTGYRDREVDTHPSGPGFVVTGVPEGKRLVIEHIAFRLESPDEEDGFTGRVFASLQTSVRVGTFTNVVDHALMVTRPQPPREGPTGFFVVSQALRLYADPGTEVRLLLRPRIPLGQPVVVRTLSLSGYWVDVPDE